MGRDCETGELTGGAEVQDQPQVKILDKALRVLMLFNSEHPELGVTAVARALDMPKSTVHRILRVLAQHGFLSQDPDSRHFRLGLAVLELGRRAHAGLELRRIATPIMEQLATESGETVLLQVVSPEGDRVVCIERVQLGQGLRLILEVGATAPLHAGCSAKALLAYMAAEAIEAYIGAGLRALTPHTITDPARLRAELADIRSNGYAVSFEETDEGVAGVSVPILDHTERVVASISVSGPITRVNQMTMSTYAGMARDAAARIAERLGHRPEIAGDGASRAAVVT
jgi:IclR family transcriptional regulator, KDG regulon repressor